MDAAFVTLSPRWFIWKSKRLFGESERRLAAEDAPWKQRLSNSGASRARSGIASGVLAPHQPRCDSHSPSVWKTTKICGHFAAVAGVVELLHADGRPLLTQRCRFWSVTFFIYNRADAGHVGDSTHTEKKRTTITVVVTLSAPIHPWDVYRTMQSGGWGNRLDWHNS